MTTATLSLTPPARKPAPCIDLDAFLSALPHLTRVAVLEEVATGRVLGVYGESAHGVAPYEKGLVVVVNGRLAGYTDGPDGQPRWTTDADAAPSKAVRTRWLKRCWM